MSVLPSARDRLLLAFANLASYGVHARPAVDGPLPQARKRVITDAASRSPFAPDDYAFWCRDDESSAFDEAGNLVAPLPVHFGNRSLVAAIAQVLSDAGCVILPSETALVTPATMQALPSAQRRAATFGVTDSHPSVDAAFGQ